MSDLTDASLHDLPWRTDAPEGHAWHCPDCRYIATVGDNAAYHAVDKNHHDPELRPWRPPENGGMASEQLARAELASVRLDVQTLAAHLRAFLDFYDAIDDPNPLEFLEIMHARAEAIRRDLEAVERAAVAD